MPLDDRLAASITQSSPSLERMLYSLKSACTEYAVLPRTAIMPSSSSKTPAGSSTSMSFRRGLGDSSSPTNSMTRTFFWLRSGSGTRSPLLLILFRFLNSFLTQMLTSSLCLRERPENLGSPSMYLVSPLKTALVCGISSPRGPLAEVARKTWASLPLAMGWSIVSISPFSISLWTARSVERSKTWSKTLSTHSKGPLPITPCSACSMSSNILLYLGSDIHSCFLSDLISESGSGSSQSSSGGICSPKKESMSSSSSSMARGSSWASGSASPSVACSSRLVHGLLGLRLLLHGGHALVDRHPELVDYLGQYALAGEVEGLRLGIPHADVGLLLLELPGLDNDQVALPDPASCASCPGS